MIAVSIKNIQKCINYAKDKGLSTDLHIKIFATGSLIYATIGHYTFRIDENEIIASTVSEEVVK